VPVDGEVVEGKGAMEESMISSEPIPSAKRRLQDHGWNAEPDRRLRDASQEGGCRFLFWPGALIWSRRRSAVGPDLDGT